MKEVSINILVHERASFLDMTMWSLSQIKQKDRVIVKFLVSVGRNNERSDHMVKQAGYRLQDAGIAVHGRAFTRLPPYNFMDKMMWLTEQPEPYIIRVDDDCFASPQTWDFLIGSTDKLDEPNVLAIAPCVTNGIPTFEYWVRTFCDNQEEKQLFDLCLQKPCLSRWGISFAALESVYKEEEWNPDRYYHLCYQTGQERLGIHPMRFSLPIQKRINQIVLENWEKFLNPPCSTLEYVFPPDRPYFCNTCFVIKKEHYRSIVRNRELKRDSFEEITFNNYRRLHGMNIGFGIDAWMMNFYYRSVGDFGLEQSLFEQIAQRINI